MAFNPRYGPVNLVLGWIGLPTPAWVVEPGAAMLALVMMATWRLGEGFVVLLASLHDIPAGLMEAGALDGASAWQRWGF